MIPKTWSAGAVLLRLPTVAVAILVAMTLRHRDWNEPFFVRSAYYIVSLMVGVYVLVLWTGRPSWLALRAWMQEHAAGLATTAAVSEVVIHAVPPSFRVLADEANLLGVSKNLFFSKTANFAVTGKWYFENYWNLNETVDRRPTLYPFLVSLLHSLRGYRPENAFQVNAIVFAFYVLFSYRLGNALGGRLFGIAAAIMVAASPNTMVAARSGGFDLLAALLLVVAVQTFHEYAREPSPRGLALFTLTLCLLAHVRVEGLALLAAGGVALAASRVVRRAHFEGYEFVYALVPVFLVSRYWQLLAKANDAEQPISATLFGRQHFWTNLKAYLQLAEHPLQFDDPHARIVIVLGLAGLVGSVGLLAWRARSGGLSPLHAQVTLLLAALTATEVAVSFAYMWGKPSQPASARLFIWLDTLMAFSAAWLLTELGRRVASRVETIGAKAGPATTVLLCAALFLMQVPFASEARFVNSLILTRQAAATWRFFAAVGEKQILILTDRPGLYTVMNYGALDISIAAQDRNCLYELSRHLYKDVYLIQEMSLETKLPMPGFEAWPDVPTHSELEFQNTDSTYVRISRVEH